MSFFLLLLDGEYFIYLNSCNAVMKYLLVIFALIFVGCSEYPITKINCTVQGKGNIDNPKFVWSYAFIDENLFQDAEVEIYSFNPNTFECGAYFQNNSSIRCMTLSNNGILNVRYNKLAKTISHEIDSGDGDNILTFIGSCEDA